MWTLATQSALLVLIFAVATGVALLLRSKRLLNIHFSLFSLGIGSFYLLYLFEHILGPAQWLTNGRFVLGGLTIVCLATFFDSLVNDAGLAPKKAKQKTLLFGLLLMLAGITPLVNFVWIQSILSVLAILVLAMRIRALVTSTSDVKNSSNKKRIRYLSCLSALALLGFIADLLAHAGMEIPAVGGIILAIYLFFMSQTLLLRRLLDLQEFFGKAAVFGFLALIFTNIFLLLTSWTNTTSGLFFINTLMGACLVIILFEPLKTFIDLHISKLFFSRHMDFALRTKEACKQLATIVELTPSIDFVLDHIHGLGRATHVAIYLFDIERVGFLLHGYRGQKPPQLLGSNHFPLLVRHVLENPAPILREKLEAKRNEHIQRVMTDASNDSPNREVSTLLETLTQLFSDVLIPMRHSDKCIGLITLQNDLINDSFSHKELGALLELLGQLAINIQNSHLFGVLKERDRLAAIGEMSAGLAHEIRNPLAAIKGAAQALEPDDVSFEDSELLQVIVEEVGRLDQVVTEFLEYARPFKGNFSPLNLNTIVRSTMQLLEHDDSGAVDIALDLDPSLPQTDGDEQKLRQVIINLLLNAKEAMQNQGKIIIRTRHLFGQDHRNDDSGIIELRIIDQGTGIPSLIKDKIFIPFFTTKQRGTGLGLALCERIIRDHYGTIDVRSQSDRGTTFIVQLPISGRNPLKKENGKLLSHPYAI